jgi:hypothetical protein
MDPPLVVPATATRHSPGAQFLAFLFRVIGRLEAARP